MVMAALRGKQSQVSAYLVAPGIVALVAVLSLARTTVQARCVAPPPPREELAQSDAVFQGVVTTIEPVKVGVNTELAVDFRVARVWKGDVGRRVSVRTYPRSDSLGAHFDVGNDYLVYAVLWSDPTISPRLPQALYTTACTRTKPYDSDEAQELGPGRAVLSTAYLPLAAKYWR